VADEVLLPRVAEVRAHVARKHLIELFFWFLIPSFPEETIEWWV
jgi:hypothetical protein